PRAERLVLRSEEPVLLHAPYGEDIRMTPEHRPTSLADALLPLEQPARTLHQRETGDAQYLLRGVVCSWVANGAKEDGSSDRRHAGDAQQIRRLRRAIQRLGHERFDLRDLGSIRLDQLDEHRDLVLEHA